MRARDQLFYPSLAVLMSGLAFAGFVFSYFRPIWRGEYPPAGAWLHLHGWSFFAWLVLLPLQAVLATRVGRAWHVRLGRASALLVALMTFTGVVVLTVRVHEAVRDGGPTIWLHHGPLILAILVLFVGFYVAAMRAARARRLEAHKRLMMVAAACGLGAGMFRLIAFVSDFHPASMVLGTVGCSVFILIGMAYDALTRRRVHPAYWIGLVTLLAVELPLLHDLHPRGVAAVNEWIAPLGELLGALYEPHPTVEF